MRATDTARALAPVLGNRDLRRLELAFAGFNAAEWRVWIAMLVYAYEQGGSTTAGLVAFAQLVPACAFALGTARLTGRHSPKRVLLAAYIAQASAMGATAGVLLAHGPPLAAYACAAVAATAVTATRPAQAALTPGLARTPAELTGANVVAGWIESASVLAAPAAAGLLIGAAGVGAVFAVMAAVALGSAASVARLPAPAPPSAGPRSDHALRVVARDPSARALTWLLAVEAMVIGALDVLYVVLAVDVLHRNGSAAGYLNAAFGAGGVLGTAATVALVGRARIAPFLIAGVAMWAAALVVLGAVPGVAAALLLLAAAGSGRILVDVSGRTLLQRSTDPELVGEVFAVIEGVSMAGLAAGSLLASGLVALAGGRGAVVLAGLLLPASLLLVADGLVAADRRGLPLVEMARLRALPMFALLPRPELELLARSAAPTNAAAGSTIVREGDRGDLYYAITSGEVDVTVRGSHVRTLGTGDGFGEIALLHDSSRTSTCVARTDCTLLTLQRDDFLAALGAGPARAAAERVAVDRLAHAR